MADKSKSLAAFQAFIETDECPDEITQNISAALHFGFEYASKRTDQEKAAPDMHEVLKEFVKGKVFSHPDAVHPSKLFCKHCGLNSRELIHSPGCLVEKAETALLKAEGREV